MWDAADLIALVVSWSEVKNLLSLILVSRAWCNFIRDDYVVFWSVLFSKNEEGRQLMIARLEDMTLIPLITRGDQPCPWIEGLKSHARRLECTGEMEFVVRQTMSLALSFWLEENDTSQRHCLMDLMINDDFFSRFSVSTREHRMGKMNLIELIKFFRQHPSTSMDWIFHRLTPQHFSLDSDLIWVIFHEGRVDLLEELRLHGWLQLDAEHLDDEKFTPLITHSIFRGHFQVLRWLRCHLEKTLWRKITTVLEYELIALVRHHRSWKFPARLLEPDSSSEGESRFFCVGPRSRWNTLDIIASLFQFLFWKWDIRDRLSPEKLRQGEDRLCLMFEQLILPHLKRGTRPQSPHSVTRPELAFEHVDLYTVYSGCQEEGFSRLRSLMHQHSRHSSQTLVPAGVNFRIPLFLPEATSWTDFSPNQLVRALGYFLRQGLLDSARSLLRFLCSVSLPEGLVWHPQLIYHPCALDWYAEMSPSHCQDWLRGLGQTCDHLSPSRWIWTQSGQQQVFCLICKALSRRTSGFKTPTQERQCAVALKKILLQANFKPRCLFALAHCAMHSIDHLDPHHTMIRICRDATRRALIHLYSHSFERFHGALKELAREVMCTRTLNNSLFPFPSNRYALQLLLDEIHQLDPINDHREMLLAAFDGQYV